MTKLSSESNFHAAVTHIHLCTLQEVGLELTWSKHTICRHNMQRRWRSRLNARLIELNVFAFILTCFFCNILTTEQQHLWFSSKSALDARVVLSERPWQMIWRKTRAMLNRLQCTLRRGNKTTGARNSEHFSCCCCIRHEVSLKRPADELLFLMT